MAAYLLVLGERAAVAWVLSNERMAFPSYRRRQALALKTGDALFLYTSRGCFHNPTTHRGRVIGTATVLGPAHELTEPVDIAGRVFAFGCRIGIGLLAPFREGVELVPLVPNLESFPNKHGWATSLRRPLVPLTARDARLLLRRLKPLAGAPADSVSGYLEAAGLTAAGKVRSENRDG